jgi:phospholipid/cholesterol/gamma-HCH transport system substrate-binding protein
MAQGAVPPKNLLQGIDDMEPRARYVLVGSFTILILAAAMLFGLWLVKGHTGGNFAYYDVLFNEPVVGLNNGSAVQYSGIQVGEVVGLSLDPSDPRKVHARVKLDGATPVKKDTTARLSITGVTGSSIIQLSGGSPGSAALVSSADNPSVIVATESALSKLSENGEDLMTNLAAITVNAKEIVSPDNARLIKQSLESVTLLSAALADQKDDIHRLIMTLGRTTRDTDRLVAHADRLIVTANTLVVRQGGQILDNTQNMTASLARASANIDMMISDNKTALNQSIAGAGDVGETMQQLRQTLASVREVVGKLDSNPSGYLLGKTRTREFTP